MVQKMLFLLQRFRRRKAVFNALKYTEELEKAGFNRNQAEASVRLLVDVMNENFATKADLNELRSATQSDIFALKSELKADITELRNELKGDIVGLRNELKGDISELRNELKGEIKELRSEVKSEVMRLESSIKEMEYKLTIKLGSMMALAIGVTATLVKILPSH